VHLADEDDLRARIDAVGVEAREQARGGSAIEAVRVKKQLEPALHAFFLPRNQDLGGVSDPTPTSRHHGTAVS